VVYWPLFTAAEWEQESGRRTAATVSERALAARTLDAVVCSEQQIEVSHGYRGEKSDAHFVLGLGWRSARPDGWFEYDLAVAPDQPAELLCRWWGEDNQHSAELLVDGVVMASPQLAGEKRLAAVEMTYPIPVELLRDKTKITVRVRANSASPTPRLLQILLLRSTGVSR
jgi:hypothetical protein